MADATKYDVAISFLASDEPVARDMASRLEEGLSVFFFPRKQEELAGTNGMESMREPFIEARVVVVLYRMPWGDTNWTRVEETAITDRCLKKGWDGLLFVVLDATSPIPTWLPSTHVRFNMETYGIEQAVGAIKFRVQEMGGVIEKASPLAHAKRVKDEIALKADQDKLFRDQAWVQGTARPVVEDLMKQLSSEAEKINTETGLKLEHGYEPFFSGFTCVLRYGRVTLHVLWKQMFSNVIDEATLECTECNGRVYLKRERMMRMREPKQLERKTYRAALNFSREMRWVDAAKPDQLLSNDDMTQRIFHQLLALVDRLNQGKVPPYEYD